MVFNKLVGDSQLIYEKKNKLFFRKKLNLNFKIIIKVYILNVNQSKYNNVTNLFNAFASLAASRTTTLS